MSDTTFVDTVTLSAAAWFNDVNNALYRGIGLGVITTIASSATPDIFAVTTGGLINYTGTATATGFTAATQAGARRTLICAGAAVFTAGANMLIDGVGSGSNFTAAANDKIEVYAFTTTQFYLVPKKYTGLPVTFSQITNSIAGDVALNNTGSYFVGPTVAQGTSGTWWASGTVTLIDTAGGAVYDAKLWDGTTVIASARHTMNSGTQYCSISLQGYIASPAGNIRISVQDTSSTSGSIIANASGDGKDSTVSAIRIG